MQNWLLYSFRQIDKRHQRMDKSPLLHYSNLDKPLFSGRKQGYRIMNPHFLPVVLIFFNIVL